jgi:hypothetical protein
LGYGFGLWCLTSLSTIFQIYRACQFYLWRKPEYPGENHQPATSHRQTLSHNVVSGTPCLSGIRTRNVSGDIQSLQLLYVHDHDNPSLKFAVCGYFNIRLNNVFAFKAEPQLFSLL